MTSLDFFFWIEDSCNVPLSLICVLQVFFREGIHPRVPEGTSWEEVEVPKEVAQLSAGPGDLLWSLLWDGNLLVRTGLSLDSPTGQHSQKKSPTCNFLFYMFCEGLTSKGLKFIYKKFAPQLFHMVKVVKPFFLAFDTFS